MSHFRRQNCSVSTFWKVIKDEKKPAFDHVPANTLVLLRVSIPVNKTFKDSLSKLELVHEELLLLVDRLSKVFADAPEEGRLHIVRIFAVKTAGTDSVSTLVKVVKDEQRPAFNHVPAAALDLWSVSIHVDKRFKGNLGMLEFANKGTLLSVDRLSKVFASPPEEGRLHIVVKVPPTGKLQWLPVFVRAKLMIFSLYSVTASLSATWSE